LIFSTSTLGSQSSAEEKLAAQIADAPAPFWRHLHDALAKRHP